MLLRTWRFITVVLVALGVTLGGAHVLETLPKMHYDAQMYAAVNSTLYRLFGTVGAVIQVGGMLAAAVLVFLVRRRPAFRPTLLGALALGLSLVAPVNAEWLRVTASAPASAPQLYLQLRDRWEYGHVAAFAAFTGFCLLVASLLIEAPADHPQRRGG